MEEAGTRSRSAWRRVRFRLLPITLAGVGVGLLEAVWLGQLARALLYEVDSLQLGLLATVALTGGPIPAQRALNAVSKRTPYRGKWGGMTVGWELLQQFRSTLASLREHGGVLEDAVRQGSDALSLLDKQTATISAAIKQNAHMANSEWAVQYSQTAWLMISGGNRYPW